MNETTYTPPSAPPPQTALAPVQPTAQELAVRPGFDTAGSFALLQRQATMFAASSVVPEAFQGKVADCAIVVEHASRCGVAPMLAFQNLYIVKGKPRWSGKFAIAMANKSGRFRNGIEFEWQGKQGQDDWGCRAFGVRLNDGKRLDGTLVTIAMVKAEGWWSKKDREGRETSKWQSMPEQMFRYRAASMFMDAHAPELLGGFGVEDGTETIEVPYRIVGPEPKIEVVIPSEPVAERPAPAQEAPKKEAKPADPAPAPAPAKRPRGGGAIREQLQKIAEKNGSQVLTQPAPAPAAAPEAPAEPEKPAAPAAAFCPKCGLERRWDPKAEHEASGGKGVYVCDDCDAPAPAEGQRAAPAEEAPRTVAAPKEVPHDQIVAWCRHQFGSEKSLPRTAIGDTMREFRISFARANAALAEARK